MNTKHEPTKEVGPILVPQNEIDPKDYPLGAVVVRFQASSPTTAQTALMNYVTERHPFQLVILGVPLIQGKMPNPLDYGAREQMIKSLFPNAQVLPVQDIPDDDAAWSREIDKQIGIAFAGKKVLLYGGRDSFIKYYSGRNKTQQLDTNRADISATDSRAFDSRTSQNSAAWRAGVIHAIGNMRPVSYPTADVAGFSPEGLMLIGQKEKDGNKWRFIGGFKEVKNTSIEEVASREFWEETGEVTNIIDPQYILSMNIDDPRYRGTGDTIFTFLMAGMIENANIITRGSDDVKNVAWLNLNYFIELGKNPEVNIIDEISKYFIKEHVLLMFNFLNKVVTYKTTWLDSIKTKIPLIASFISKFQSGSSNPWMEVIRSSENTFKSEYPIFSVKERLSVIHSDSYDPEVEEEIVNTSTEK